MDVQAVTHSIKAILTAPGVDLSTISSKRVRAQLSETYGAALIKQNKELLDALVIQLYNEVVNSTGIPQEDVKREEAQEHFPVAQPPSVNGHAHAPESKPRPSATTTSSRPAPPASDQSSEDAEEDGSASDYDEDAEEEKKPSTSAGKPKQPKASPQKRRLQADAIPPESSPSVPLAMATGLTDEEYARQLQEEMNAAARGRATRGGGFQKRAKKGGSKKNGSSSAAAGGGGKKKYRTKDYIDDSDAGEGHDGSEEDDDSGSDASVTEKKPKKKRAGGGGGGGYMKELALSEPLQQVCGATTMARPSIVKQLWAYIREHNLQNPAKKSEIINDELFTEIFGVKTMTMFSMNKYLKKAVKPIDG